MLSILEPQPPIGFPQRAMMVVSESALATSVPHGVVGYCLGAAFTLFGSMISVETSTQAMGTADFFRHSLRNCHRMGCNFAAFSFFFGGLEVALEKRRGRKDKWNPTISGGVLGGFYGWRTFKYVGLTGGIAAGAALSLAFERLTDAMGFAQH
ncbi:mitochondrial import inner membrane translocase subunit TIM17 [Novymonas esmeraldas]|uniref:Mitochondrial import inner membrane translocase subunit TIM22 n=1 Tax=Novymonas esmeraldas TaxID=1808958 RepID=A0AAW0EWQ5_9TRYP